MLLRIAQSAPLPLEFPSVEVVERWVRDTAKESHETILQNIPQNTKVLDIIILLDIHFLIRIHDYQTHFIDKDSNYHEILLGYQPLEGAHLGAYLKMILLKLSIGY